MHGSPEAGGRARRLAAVRAAMAERGAAAFVCVAPGNQTYLSGFRALLYSRPILLLVEPGETRLVVPGLEEAHARAAADVDVLDVYYEHPEGTPVRTADEHVHALLQRLPAGAPIAVELEACPTALALAIRADGRELVDLGPDLTALRAVKDEDELALIRDAARVLEGGVAASLAACAVGVTELEIDAAGTAAVHRELAGAEGEVTLEQLVMTPSGPRRSILPHAFSTTRALRPGDVLIHTRQVGLNGYRAELERTLLVGPVSPERRRTFEVMTAAQQAALDAVRPGATCADVDRAARGVIAAEGLGAYAIHRTGHGIGLSAHEQPHMRFDDDTPLVEHMVITLEPGIYVPGLGGFRHSDTVVVTREGADVLTAHARDAERLTVGE